MEGAKVQPLISFVVPVFNEEMNIEPFYQAVSAAIAPLEDRYRFEFVFTDNHSADATFLLLGALAQRDSRVSVYRFSRNFGYQRSIMTGYARARGDAAIQLDVDLQDPPELVGRFLEEWERGADVVYGVRVKRQESWFINVQRGIFYRMIDLLSEDKIPVDAGDFRLISRRVIDLLKTYEDAQPYLRGTIATLGFTQVGIPYSRNARERGESKFSFSKLISLALDGILNHSTVPLRLSTYFGLTVSFLTLLSIGGYIAAKFITGATWPAGFATLAALILASLSINAMLLGIIGEYLGRMYRQVKKQPLTIIENAVIGSGVDAGGDDQR
ncbi:glycosyltransferase family 2 protein [Terriglobus roseus]|uniref:Dolichol-phosphate mannosyltransferase n=1 Tax=Terriglobus roseus TaxID=392734 RepID=A0A1G7KXF9_9BACT|nr:glycosyltransferase family 2 protein [Terriglobus roseus]SDF41938.1 dolichol-phosphate mannosyltransferase [Terriglobus roseus]